MTEALFDLSGKVAVITGASRGIGQAIAEAFAGTGAAVVLASRKQEGLERVAAGIRAAGGQALPVATHTGDREAVRSLFVRAAGEFGGVDIVVNNAGTNPHFGPLLSAEESHWLKTLDVNVVGYFRVAKEAVPHMKDRGGGAIINMASVAGRMPLPGMGVYCASKAAVLMLTEALAVELAAANIRVNAIAPGFVKTRFSQALWGQPQIYQAIVRAVPQERMASAAEITGAALYLASDASAFTTGATLVVDGGQLAGAGSVFSMGASSTG